MKKWYVIFAFFFMLFLYSSFFVKMRSWQGNELTSDYLAYLNRSWIIFLHWLCFFHYLLDLKTIIFIGTNLYTFYVRHQKFPNNKTANLITKTYLEYTQGTSPKAFTYSPGKIVEFLYNLGAGCDILCGIRTWSHLCVADALQEETHLRQAIRKREIQIAYLRLKNVPENF